ncbi:ABC transporter substrate-binding protein [Microbacterium sp. SORGH_AS_0888]|uniref:ABC transporter substrate-binding protein n=1 Tax=Microbacterium sp. SORGH_AS_0888 TaxID=3041791 RepID=UPI0027840C68|nr:ABC transporter substrate-binding protein [Microbacterium sp. SORGH_AS_0888]MDQ1130652.1 iron complex transport system substrate-binding protein [Microbacterium sp. SORGH_AS_0888]
MTRISRVPRARSRIAAALTALAIATTGLAACSGGGTPAAAARNATYSTTPSDSFPVTVTHQFGSTTIPAEPQRIVVVGLTEQDVLLELGTPPIATTEWYGEQPHAVWPWATDLLNGADPVVLHTTDGFEYEKIASLDPDLIVGTNAGLTEEDYTKLSALAPTVASVAGAERFFSSWQDQTRQIAKAVGRTAEGERLIQDVADAYRDAATAHPEFAGLTATFSQGAPYDGQLYVYPDGLNTDFLTDLGFRMTPGLEKYAAEAGQQAQLSAENTNLMDADVIVFATEEESGVKQVLDFGTVSSLRAVTGRHAVFTDGTLAGAIYFLTPLSQKYVVEKLVPRLADAVAGTAPQSIEG